MAAAAWSCVEKMLQEHQRTSAPSAVSVSISTAVCTVMCREPAILAPCSARQQSCQPPRWAACRFGPCACVQHMGVPPRD